MLLVHPRRRPDDAVPDLGLAFLLELHKVFFFDLVHLGRLVDAEDTTLVRDALDDLVLTDHAARAEDAHGQGEVLLQLVLLLETVGESLLL